VAPGTQHLPVFVGRRWLVHLQRHIITAYELPTLRPVGRLPLDPAEDVPEIVHRGPDGASVLVGTRRGVLLRFACAGDSSV